MRARLREVDPYRVIVCSRTIDLLSKFRFDDIHAIVQGMYIIHNNNPKRADGSDKVDDQSNIDSDVLLFSNNGLFLATEGRRNNIRICTDNFGTEFRRYFRFDL